MPTTHLTERATIAVTGNDAEKFLQNIVTTDLDHLAVGEARPGALLSPQGKILFDFLISRTEHGFRLECRTDMADDFVRRLMMYKLRANVEIIAQKQCLVGVRWNVEAMSSESDSSVQDRRFASVQRFYDEMPPADAEEQAWRAFRIASGVPESGEDFELGEAFPHDALLDQMNGVGFKKGCYIGQEVVSRMQHRGTARRRFLIAEGASALPESGAAVMAGDRPVGSLGSVAGNMALALVRIDRVADALEAGIRLTAGGVGLALTIPPFATFAMPTETASAAEA